MAVFVLAYCFSFLVTQPVINNVFIHSSFIENIVVYTVFTVVQQIDCCCCCSKSSPPLPPGNLPCHCFWLELITDAKFLASWRTTRTVATSEKVYWRQLTGLSLASWEKRAELSTLKSAQHSYWCTWIGGQFIRLVNRSALRKMVSFDEINSFYSPQIESCLEWTCVDSLSLEAWLSLHISADSFAVAVDTQCIADIFGSSLNNFDMHKLSGNGVSRLGISQWNRVVLC
jgi:hypothetical protein